MGFAYKEISYKNHKKKINKLKTEHFAFWNIVETWGEEWKAKDKQNTRQRMSSEAEHSELLENMNKVKHGAKNVKQSATF